MLLLPHTSVAVTVTVVKPTGNEDPEAGTEVIVTAPAQLSVAVGTKLTGTAQVPAMDATVMFAGQVNTGAV